jgi:hypothetical protein
LARPPFVFLVLFLLSPTQIVRAAHGLTVENQFELVPTVAKAKEPFLDLANSSDDFVASLGYKRESDGTYRILKRNRDVGCPPFAAIGITCRENSCSRLSTNSRTYLDTLLLTFVTLPSDIITSILL